MQKLLLATTALIASATLANAQAFTVSGEGRMGVQYNSTGIAGGSNYQIEHRLTLDFNVAVEADHGLTFGAWTRARMQMGGGTPVIFNSNQTGTFSGSRVWVEASGLRLTFGNMDGAIATAGTSHGWLGGCMVGYEGGMWCGDSAGLDTAVQTEPLVGPAPAQRLMVTYAIGNTNIAVSHDRGAATEIGIQSSFDAVTVALGYANQTIVGSWTAGAALWTLSGHYNGGAWGVGAVVARSNSITNWSLSGNVGLGGGDFYAYVGRVNGDNTYGLNYGYGLGGGATLTAGAERIGGVTNTTVASVCVAFTF